MTKHLTQKWKELVEDILEHTIGPEIRPDYRGNNMYRLKINFISIFTGPRTVRRAGK